MDAKIKKLTQFDRERKAAETEDNETDEGIIINEKQFTQLSTPRKKTEVPK